jgi:hypothetical protein
LHGLKMCAKRAKCESDEFSPLSQPTYLLIKYGPLSPPRSSKFPPPYRSSEQNCVCEAFVIPPMRPACPSYLIFLNRMILVTFDEEQKLRNSSLCNFLQPPGLLYLFRSKYSLRHHVLKHIQCMRERRCHAHTKQQIKLRFCTICTMNICANM